MMARATPLVIVTTTVTLILRIPRRHTAADTASREERAWWSPTTLYRCHHPLTRPHLLVRSTNTHNAPTRMDSRAQTTLQANTQPTAGGAKPPIGVSRKVLRVPRKRLRALTDFRALYGCR